MRKATEHVKQTFGFWKTTLVGGLIFLLPLVAIGMLVGKIAPAVYTAAKKLLPIIPAHTAGGFALLVALILAVLLTVCFLAGLIARGPSARRLYEAVEKNITTMFPRYLVVKELMAGKLDSRDDEARLKPVAVTTPLGEQIGLEVERGADGSVTVFLPGAPDPWDGSVASVEADRVRPLDVSLADTLATFEQLGRGSAKLLGKPEG